MLVGEAGNGFIMKTNTIKMHCEKCKEPTSKMVALPRRRHKDGTVICFWQLCLKCAKEVLNANKNKVRNRNMPQVQLSKDVKSGSAEESIKVRRLRPVVRGINGGNKNDKICKKNCKKCNCRKAKEKTSIKSRRIGIKLLDRRRKEGSNKLRNDDGSKNVRRKKKNIRDK